MEEKNFYSSPEWLTLKKQALEKYGAICMQCGPTQNIYVDHIKPRKKFPNLELVFDNLQILCETHNLKKGY